MLGVLFLGARHPGSGLLICQRPGTRNTLPPSAGKM